MLVLEYKVKAKQAQYQAIDEAIRTVQFIRNKCIRHWMDTPKEAKLDKSALSRYSTELRNEFKFVKDLNSIACQCGCILHRDTNTTINIFHKARSRVGDTGSNAKGVATSTLIGATQKRASSYGELRIPVSLGWGVSINSNPDTYLETFRALQDSSNAICQQKSAVILLANSITLNPSGLRVVPLDAPSLIRVPKITQ